MPKAVRIDRISTDPTGSVTVEYSKGEGPLPAPGGQALTYTSMAALFDAIRELEATLPDEYLVFMALSAWLKVDAQMANATLGRNRTAQLDLTGSGTVVRVA